jgi:hypothetical protein
MKVVTGKVTDACTARQRRCQHRRPLPLRTVRRLQHSGLGRKNGVEGIYEHLQIESRELG